MTPCRQDEEDHMPVSPSDPLIGRDREIERLVDLLDAAEGADGGALVLRGEAGIGKTALMDHIDQLATGRFRVFRASGSEFEAELPFAALHQLCAPVLSDLDALPAPYRHSLTVAFGLAQGASDPFGVGLAALELLSTAAEKEPLLCLVDDAHWLDSASRAALVFLARRIATLPVAIVFASREPSSARGLGELPGLAVEGLTDADARQLLARHQTVATLDDKVRDRLLSESRGNPLALIELPKSNDFFLPTPSPVIGRIERSFQIQMSTLPPDARRLLLLASAEPTGDLSTIWAAAPALDIDVPVAVDALDGSGLVILEENARFCHPLARSAAYRASEPAERRAAHAALAGATDSASAPDRHAWHRAQAATGPDEEVAAQLASTASRAVARGGVAASAVFLKRAAALSCDPAARIERTIAAARATVESGRPDAAAELLDGVDIRAVDEDQRATLDVLRGQIVFAQGGADAVVRGPDLIMGAASRLSTSDPERSRRLLVTAVEIGLSVGRGAGVLDRVLDAARAAPPAPPRGDILDALLRLTDEGHAAAIPEIRHALAEGDVCWGRAPALATVLAGELWDLDLHAQIVDWLVHTGRETGAPVVVRLGLAQSALHSVLTGELEAASAAISEEEAIAEIVGDLPQLYPRVHLAAVRGHRDEVFDLVAEGNRRSNGVFTGNLSWARAVLYNGRAEYPAALDAAQKAVGSGDLFLAGFALPELIEAAVRSDEHALAESALTSLLARTDAAGTETAAGIAAGARALVHDSEKEHRRALAHLTHSSLPVHLARAHLRYGEWLRRAGRRRDARHHLDVAHTQLSTIGAEGFAARAAQELRLTGEHPRDPSGNPYEDLTEQEVHVAQQVATGATTKEVATSMFISPRTVDAHLRSIFRKLDISSRRQLKDFAEHV
jgi:DNA-binding CsgD family transcriptional regulator